MVQSGGRGRRQVPYVFEKVTFPVWLKIKMPGSVMGDESNKEKFYVNFEK